MEGSSLGGQNFQTEVAAPDEEEKLFTIPPYKLQNQALDDPESYVDWKMTNRTITCYFTNQWHLVPIPGVKPLIIGILLVFLRLYTYTMLCT